MKGSIHIDTYQKTGNDPNYRVEDVVLIRFMNTGQDYISFDEKNVVIKPGEVFVEGDLNGPGIDHTYNIGFITNPSPPGIDNVFVKGLRFLEIRTFKRHRNARK